jgi:uncharacterized protein (DUF2141 family)
MVRVIVVVSLLAAPPQALPEGSGSIAVTIPNVRNAAGTVRCALFTAAPGFPGASPLDRGQNNARATKGEVRCTFERVPPGTYAVSVLHDENDDSRLDTNFFGIPKEGYGASNNVLPATSGPTFEASRFTLADGERRALSVTLKY